MFTDSARIYDLIYSWKDYPAETRRVHSLIQQHASGARTLLDVACGTGKHLEELARTYEAEGLDLDRGLLEIAAQRNPGVPLHEGDMTDFDLGKHFDAVTCLFSSVGYVLSLDNLDRALAAMARHLNPRGVLLLEPWFSPDEWIDGRPHAVVVDEPDLKIVRMNVSTSEDKLSVLHFHYLMADTEGVAHFEERHCLGLFTHEEYLRAFAEAGLQASYDDWGLEGRGLYVATAPR